jgi:hypothetical protein
MGYSFSVTGTLPFGKQVERVWPLINKRKNRKTELRLATPSPVLSFHHLCGSLSGSSPLVEGDAQITKVQNILTAILTLLLTGDFNDKHRLISHLGRGGRFVPHGKFKRAGSV